MAYLIGIAIALHAFVSPSYGDSEKKNCKLAVRTSYLSGKKKVEIDEVHAPTREDCKLQAKDRERNPNPREIAGIKVTFGYRD